MSVVKDVDLEAMPTSIFLNDDDDKSGVYVGLPYLRVQKQGQRLFSQSDPIRSPT